ncbi:hypothetical protein V7068_12205 [Bacillus sp. JJ634]
MRDLRNGCRMSMLARIASSTRARGSGDRAGCDSRRPMSKETRAAAAWRSPLIERGMLLRRNLLNKKRRKQLFLFKRKIVFFFVVASM